jgi:hypothetical protein
MKARSFLLAAIIPFLLSACGGGPASKRRPRYLALVAWGARIAALTRQEDRT